jgi:hypothetical protein
MMTMRGIAPDSPLGDAPDDALLADLCQTPAAKSTLSARAFGAIAAGPFTTVGDLRRAADHTFRRIPNCGRKTTNELRWAFGARFSDVADREPPLRPEPLPTPTARLAVADDGQVYLATPLVALERNREIARLYVAGVPPDDIGLKFGMTGTRIRQLARQMEDLEAKLATAGRITFEGASK